MAQLRGNRCSVCNSPDKWRIELLHASGASLDALAKKFAPIGRDAIWRHWQRHVTTKAKSDLLCGPAQLAELAEVAASEGTSIIDHFRVLRTHLMARLADCSEAGDARATAALATALTGVLERLGRITGELSNLANSHLTVNFNLLESPQFGRVQAAILKALASHPAARADVVQALRSLEQDQPPPSLQPARAPLIEAAAHVG